MRCSLIDLGSNTVRLVVYEVKDNAFTEIFNESMFLGLISHTANGHLDEEGYQSILEALGKFSQIISLLSCKKNYCIATASLRGINNCDEIISEVKEKTGIKIEIISGEQEAYYDFCGLLHSKPQLLSGMGCDIGGGSGQIFGFDNSQITLSVSLPIGCLRIYNEFVSGVIPDKNERDKLYKYVKKLISQNDIKLCPDGVLYAMGGTARAMAKLHRGMLGIEGSSEYQMDVKDITTMCDTICNMGMNGIKLLNKIIPARSHTIIPGMLVIKAIAKTVGAKQIVVVKSGVRDGFVMAEVISKRKKKKETV